MKTLLGGILLLLATRTACADLAQDVFEKLELPPSLISINGESVQGKILSGLVVYEKPDRTYVLLIDEANINPRELFHLLHVDSLTEENVESANLIPEESVLQKNPLETQPEVQQFRREVAANFYCLKRVTINKNTFIGRSGHYQCFVGVDSPDQYVTLATSKRAEEL